MKKILTYEKKYQRSALKQNTRQFVIKIKTAATVAIAAFTDT